MHVVFNHSEMRKDFEGIIIIIITWFRKITTVLYSENMHQEVDKQQYIRFGCCC